MSKPAYFDVLCHGVLGGVGAKFPKVWMSARLAPMLFRGQCTWLGMEILLLIHDR